MRWNNFNTNRPAERTKLLARLALVLTATVAVFALADARDNREATPVGRPDKAGHAIFEVRDAGGRATVGGHHENLRPFALLSRPDEGDARTVE